MAMTIETVSIEDVYPLEDRYGNQYLSRDYTTKENIAYVNELARSMAAKGVPDEPVILVRDGGIYRIKSGNSRVMAMRQLGTKSFPAIIDEDDTPQALIETTIRTNAKKKYEPVEESGFVQQLVLIAPDEYVSDVTGMEVDKVKRIRKARGLVDDAAEDMSLLRLITIGEFSDDPEAVEQLTNCTEKEYERVADGLRRERVIAEKKIQMEEAFAARGIEVVEAAPEDLSYLGYVYELARIPDDVPGDCVAVRVSGCDYRLYGTKLGVEVDQEKETLHAEFDRYRALWDVTDKARTEWMVAHLNDPMPKLWELGDVSPFDYEVDEFIKDNNIEAAKGIFNTIASFCFMNRSPISSYQDGMHDRGCSDFRALTDVLKEYGYEPPQEEEELYCLVKEHLAEEEGDE